MNRVISLIVIVVGATGVLSSGSAQSTWATSEGSVYGKGSAILNLGIGTYPIGPYVAYDYGIHDAISVGGAAGYQMYWNWGSDYTFHWMPIVARAAFHPFNLTVVAEHVDVRDKLDVYAGPVIGIGFRYDNYTGPYSHLLDDKFDVYPIVREYIGIRYYVNDRIAWFAEEGSGLGWFNVGLSMKM